MSELTDLKQILAQTTKTLNMLVEDNRNKAAAGVQTANQLHGLGGLWSTTTERQVITAHIRPMGIANHIPLIPTVNEDPHYGILTGYTAEQGTNPTNACDDAPSAFVKGCTQTARFGMVRKDTNTVEFNKTMLRVNRGDFMDLRLTGRVLGLTDLEPNGLNESEVLNIITMSEMVTAGVIAERDLVTQMFQGTFGVGTQFAGLDSQIVTGIIDSETGIACPAVDSDIKDFDFDDIEGGGRSIVNYLATLEYVLYTNAQRMGLLPWTAAIVMRPDLWQILTDVWPCQYNTGKCATSIIGDNSRTVIDGRENIVERDRMRTTMTIEVNGRRYGVILDDGINEQTNITTARLNAGEFASSLYFVPLTIVGNFPVTYREFLSYNTTISNRNTALLLGNQDFWTDGGQYTWAIENNKWCFKLALKTEQRIILRTPHLAGKIDNIKYIPLQHTRSFDPASSYFQDGGISVRNAPAFQAVWAQ